MQDGSKRRARLILIVGILLAVLAGGGTFLYASSAQTAQAPVIETVGVVVAAREIPAKTQLTAADVRVQQFLVDARPAAAVTKPEDAIGKITITPINVGEPIFPSKFSDPKNPAFVVIPATALDATGAILSSTPLFRAMSITVADANAVGGVIQPGDIVDLMYTIQFDPQKFLVRPTPVQMQDFSVKILLEKLPILARTGSVYTIRVDTQTAERIGYLQASGGQLHFLLRAPKDERPAATTGVSFSDVQRTYHINIPEKIQ